jgi:hypothetical protein
MDREYSGHRYVGCVWITRGGTPVTEDIQALIGINVSHACAHVGSQKMRGFGIIDKLPDFDNGSTWKHARCVSRFLHKGVQVHAGNAPVCHKRKS